MGLVGKLSGLLAVAAILTSCALSRSSGKQPVIKQCVLPEDQINTMSGKWKITPIPIAFHEGEFSAQEMQLVGNAVNTWNTFYAASLGLQPLDIGTGGYNVSSAPKPSNPCQPITNGTSYTGSIVLYKLGTWPSSYAATAIALTTTCPSPGQPYPNFYGSIMELNYQNFFVAGKKLPDLQSILLHEFGHVLGLNHSCEGTGAPGVPGCNDFGTSSAYQSAVMAPTFTFDSQGIGEQKRNLTANDQGRANCLYAPP